MKKTIPPLKSWSRFLKSGNRVFVGSNAACPQGLVRSLLDNLGEVTDLEMVHILTLGKCPWSDSQYAERLRVNALFLGADSRQAVARGDADYTPCFLSEIPSLFVERTLPLDVALIQVSPPDKDGYCSLGVSVDIVSAAARSARFVIAQVNPQMPRTFGQSFIHVDQIDAALYEENPLPELPLPPHDDVSDRIGRNVATLIENGSTLQLGIGKIPDSVLKNLTGHQNLGLHTEMMSDGAMDLIQAGVINNREKTINNGLAITSFCMGTRKLYDFVHENPHVAFHPSEYVNNPAVISKHDKIVAVNSAIEVDLTGQVVSDSMGHRFFSGIGGQVDFIRGAALSRGGIPIIALPSTAKKGTLSRIVPFIAEGSGVVTSRGDVHFVVTEHGIATLRGRSIRERALELIQVADPAFRDQLLARVREHFWVPSYTRTKIGGEVAELGKVKMQIVQLKGKPYFLRSLHPSDERRLQEFFYSHTPETLSMRYRIPPKQMSREKAHHLVNMEPKEGLALCIGNRKGPREEIHAVGRYIMDEDGKSAEVAFVVRENKRRKGMARTLLNRIIKVAAKRGLSRLTARVLLDNMPTLALFAKFHFKQESEVNDNGEIIMALSLEGAAKKQDE